MSDTMTGELAIVPGTKDILNREQEFFTYIKKVVRHRCRQGGFRRIATPIFEFVDLFKKGLGEDFINKMYTFTDPSGHKLALRPEGTTPIVRAYVGNKMSEWPQPVQLYYIEPFFKLTTETDKKTAACSYQFGAEIMGEADPALEAQLMQLAYKVLQDTGIAHAFKLQINTLGCRECREPYLNDLRDFYFGKERSLCEACKGWLDSNPMRLLSCPEEDCTILAELAPKIEKYLCKSCVQDFKDVQGYLSELSINFQVNAKLARPFNYYTGIIFEFADINGGKNGLGGGGRYDELIERLTGKSLAGAGFALSIEKMIEVMRKEKIKVPSKDALQVFVAQLGDEAKKKCLVLMNQLREAGIKTVGTLGKGSMREQLTLAQQFKVPYMTLMGLTEVREGNVIIRDMKIGSQKTVPFEQAVTELISVIGEENLDKYTPGEVLY